MKLNKAVNIYEVIKNERGHITLIKSFERLHYSLHFGNFSHLYQETIYPFVMLVTMANHVAGFANIGKC